MAQVADLMASADKSLLDDAAELLRRAIELEPNTLSHREQLGEALDLAGKKDESLTAWRSMAEEPRRSASNLAHLAEVLSRFGYRDESLTTIDAACELDRKSLELRFQQAELRRKWKQAESAMAALREAAALADTPETFDRVVQLEVKVLSESERLTERIEELNAETQRHGDAEPADGRKLNPESSPAHQYFRLAKYLEAADKLREATVAARKAVELAPKNGVFLQAAAKMLTQDSQWLSAVELYERLMKLDRRFRIDSLRSIAELEQKLGRKEKALKAGRDLLAAAPGNPEVAEFVADVSLRFNQNAEALQILRRASRQNAADKRLALKLVERLMETPEANLKSQISNLKSGPPNQKSKIENQKSAIEESREILWRVFEQTAKTDDRIEVIRKLAELSVFPGEFAKLTQRLERLRHEPKLARDAALALVQVHEQAGDTEQARRELERLLPQAPRDVELLKRMVSLSESTGDLNAAISHQKRLAELTRKRESDEHLIVLLRRAGRDADADVIATRWLESERDPVKVLKEIDRLLTSQRMKNTKDFELASKLAQSWLDRDAQNWEFLARKGFALHLLGRINEAHVAFDQVIALGLPDDAPSILLATPSDVSAEAKVAARVHRIHLRFMYPRAYPDAGAVRRLILLTRKKDKSQNSAASPEIVPDDRDVQLRRAWDDVYLTFFDPESKARHQSCMTLLALAPDDAGAQWLALFSLWNVRQFNHWLIQDAWQNVVGQQPLESAEIDRLVAAFRNLQSCDAAMMWHTEAPLIEMVSQELLRGNRKEDATRLLHDVEEKTPSPDALGWLIQRACRDGDVEATLRLLPKYAASFRGSLPPMPPGTPANTIWPSDPALVAWWLQHLVWRQLEVDLSEQPFGQRVVSAAGKENVLRIVSAALDTFAESRIPKSSPTFFTLMTHLWQTDKRANLSNARLPLPNAPGMQGLGQDFSLLWISRNHLGRTTLPFPNVAQTSERSVLSVVLQAMAMGGHWDTQKLDFAGGSPDWQSELREHLLRISQRSADRPEAAFLANLCRSSLFAWQGKSADALPAMKELFEHAMLHPTVQLEVVSYIHKHERNDLALDLLDRIETKDGQLLKVIEQRAVQLAGKLHRSERVQLAAERLFGMKLEPAEELQLAATLSGLGLHEQAEAIRQRLPQRAGNNLAVLQQAMQERIDAKKLDEACQIAEQIVRRTSPANTLIGSVQQSTFGGGQQARVITTTSTARTKALALLGQQGRLGPLIEQAEQQFDRSPQSLKLFGQLVELYGADQPGEPGGVSPRTGNEKNVRGLTPTGSPDERIARLLVRLADSDSPDPQFRLTLARALVSAGKAQLAVPHFLFAIEKLPNATAQVLFEAEAILSELGHTEELARIVLKSKLAVNDQQRIELFSRIVQKLEGPPIRAKLIIDLFEKAFREAPDFRPLLAARLLSVSESVWQQEEMWPIARDLAVPPESLKTPGPWYGVDVSRLHSGKQIDSITQRTIELAAQLKKLDELGAVVEAAMKTHPDWTLGGNVTLGLIRLKQGRLDDAKTLFAAALKPKSETAPIQFGPKQSDYQGYDAMVCGVSVELARARDFEAAAAFYELSSDTATVLEHCRWFGKEPAMQQLAVRIVNRMLAGLDNPDELTRQAGSPLFIDAAKITSEINQPYVAARLAQAMITRWQLPGANNSDGGTWLEQLDRRFTNSLAAIKPEMLPEIVGQVSNLPEIGRAHV